MIRFKRKLIIAALVLLFNGFIYQTHSQGSNLSSSNQKSSFEKKVKQKTPVSKNQNIEKPKSNKSTKEKSKDSDPKLNIFREALNLDLENNLKEALKKYKLATKQDSCSSIAWNNIGLIQQKLGKEEKAEQSYKKAIEVKPTDTQAINNLASLKLLQGKTIEAKNLYEKAIEIDPDYPYSYSNLGNLYKRYGRFFRAVEYYKKAIDKAPVAEFYYRLGLLYFDMKRYEDMLETFQKGLNDNSEFSEIYYSLCIVYFHNFLNQSNEIRLQELKKAFTKLKKTDTKLAQGFYTKFLTSAK
ncbi:MAG: tetratricopeptide repeat protein [Candidatus Caenarcaniphilales bacterium]|nr:tetratricopeptide repeat protein [Candidatus Caenarcaniphilales bacterium]